MQKKKTLSCLQDNVFLIVFQWPRPCPGVDTPPQSLPSSLLKIQHKNIAILLVIKGIAIVNVKEFYYI